MKKTANTFNFLTKVEGITMITMNLYLFALVSLISPCLGQDVIVIGAGTSGIGAARTLVDHGGFNVTVLEANPDRYGGRMWTNREITSDGSGNCICINKTDHLWSIQFTCRALGTVYFPLPQAACHGALGAGTGTGNGIGTIENNGSMYRSLFLCSAYIT